MTTTTMRAAIEGVGALGPGFANWTGLQAIFAQPDTYTAAATVLPPPALLPAAERRRAVPAVRLTLAAGTEAVAQTTRDIRTLASVFASSGGDAQNIHAICETLAGPEREISPTRFHNSVHNAASGYWGIATGATAASTALCAFDGSFGAGLLDAMSRVVTTGEPVLLIAYDVDYPEPLRSARPIPAPLAIALLLAPAGATGGPTIALSLDTAPPTPLTTAALEPLREQIPAARGLPLLEALALRRPGRLVLDYLQGLSLGLDLHA